MWRACRMCGHPRAMCWSRAPQTLADQSEGYAVNPPRPNYLVPPTTPHARPPLISRSASAFQELCSAMSRRKSQDDGAENIGQQRNDILRSGSMQVPRASPPGLQSWGTMPRGGPPPPPAAPRRALQTTPVLQRTEVVGPDPAGGGIVGIVLGEEMALQNSTTLKIHD